MEKLRNDVEGGYKQQSSEEDLPTAGNHDQVAEIAKGGQVEDLPPGYYWSPNFIGTLVAACGGSIAAYLGTFLICINLPRNTLADNLRMGSTIEYPLTHQRGPREPHFDKARD